MKKAIEKASALIEAMEYIRQFRKKIVVVKLGGSVLDDAELGRKMLTDIAFMATVGIYPVIVHGGGKAITTAMTTAGIEPVWVQGRRYTDQVTLNIVEHTLAEKLNEPICQTLQDLGCQAMTLNSFSSCVLQGKLLRLDGADGRKLDLGRVGTVTGINAELLKTLCQARTIPVIAPIAKDGGGNSLNVNADTAAGMVAAQLAAEKLVMVSDTHGIRTDVDDADSWVTSLNEKQIKDMIASGVISGAMLPKVEACLTAIDGGAKKAHIIDGRFEHSLLLEIYTNKGIGTEIIS